MFVSPSIKEGMLGKPVHSSLVNCYRETTWRAGGGVAKTLGLDSRHSTIDSPGDCFPAQVTSRSLTPATGRECEFDVHQSFH